VAKIGMEKGSSNYVAYSDAFRPLIPIDSGHLFRSIPASTFRKIRKAHVKKGPGEEGYCLRGCCLLEHRVNWWTALMPKHPDFSF